MWKYLAALLVVLLTMGGLVAAQVQECTDCYANIVTQSDAQTIQTVGMAQNDPTFPGTAGTVAVGNEGLSAGIIVTKAPDTSLVGDVDQFFVPVPFARISQKMDQTTSNLGSVDINLGDGAKGITWNKAIQAAWVANQGVKEYKGELPDEYAEHAKEGAYVSQSTTQLTDHVYDYDSREQAKVLNVDNKLAMIVDNVKAVLALTANADSTATDTQSSTGDITNTVGVNIGSLPSTT